MKTLLLISFPLLCIVTCSWCQDDRYDTLDKDKIRINQLELGEDKKSVIKAFGKPAKIEKAQSMEDEWFAYYYKRSIIQISLDGYFKGFEIADTNFVLTYKTTKIRVGDSLSILKKMFPKSYKHYLGDKTGYFRLRFGDTDEYFFFIIKNGIIVHFKNWFDDL